MPKKRIKPFTEVYQSGQSGKLVKQSLVGPDGTVTEVELCVSLICDDQGNR